MPQYALMKIQYALSSDYRNILDNASVIAGLRDNLLTSYETLPTQELDRISKVLPDDVNTVELALGLDNIASRYGIAVKSVGVNTGESQDAALIVLPEYQKPYDKVTVSLGFVSTYSNFMSLLKDLEKNLRIMDVKSVAFQSTESRLYEYLISFDTYWLKDPATLPVAGASSSVGADLLALLDKLDGAVLDTTLFTSPSYLLLEDFSTTIPTETTGRSNPFDLIGRD